MRRSILSAGVAFCVFAVATGLAMGQTVPTFNDVFVADVGLEAGGTRALRMDIYRPTGVAGTVPVVAFIHGGGWQSGTYDNVLPAVRSLLNQGIAVASIDYRLSGENIYPSQIHDVKAGIRHLRANASTYGIDARRMGTWGPSAGGHLAALLATSGGVATLEGTVGPNLGTSSRVVAGVDYFGPTDLLNMQLDITTPPGSAIDHDAPTSGESRLFGFDGPGQGVGVLRANLNNPAAPYPQLAASIISANPITHLDASDPVMHIAHGTIDRVVPLNQSRRLRDAMTAAGVPFEYSEIDGAGHGNLGTAADAAARAFIVKELTRPFGDANRDDAVDFADLVLLAQNYRSDDRGWRQGDFDADGTVSFTDLVLLAQNYGLGADDATAPLSFHADWARAQSLVPEPAGAAAAVLAISGATLRRRLR